MPQEFSAKGGPASGWEIGISKLESPPAAGGKFVQVFESNPEEDVLSKRGILFAVLELTVDPAADPQVAGKLVWDTLAEEYYALPSEETPISALERAVYSARAKLRSFSEKSGLEMGASAFKDNVVYFARIGRPALYLRRGSDVRNLLPGEEAAGIGSQLLEGNDLLVLGSPGFARNFSPQTLPETEFLEREFEKGGEVPGLAAFLFEIKSSQGAQAAISPKLSPPPVFQLASRFLGKASALGAVLGKALGPVKDRIPNLPNLPNLSSIRSRISMPRLILILAAVFLISVAFTLWQQSKRVQAGEFDRLVAVASDSLSQAEGLVGLSNEKAKELIDKAQNSLANAAKLSPNSEKLDPLSAKAVTLFNAIEKITPVTEENLAYDLGDGARGLSLTGAGGIVYVAEEKSGSVFAVTFGDPPTSENLSVSGVELVLEEGYLYLRGKEKLSRLNLANKAVDEPISFDRWDKAAAADTYLGNIYLLVPEENQIYKFLVTQSGYSSAREWLKEALTLGEAADMAVDGEIWVLTIRGQIYRLAGGNTVPFTITNLSTPLQNPNKIFTRPSFKNIYVLDKGANRAVVLDKNGNFVRQFKGDVLLDLIDLWVSSDEKTLFLLSGNKIYQAGL